MKGLVMNLYKNLSVLSYLLICSLLLAQNQNSNEQTETITLEVQKITVEPPKPQIALKIKEIKPREYDFFRSFEDEVKSVPADLFNIKVNQEESKVENLDKILTKERK